MNATRSTGVISNFVTVWMLLFFLFLYVQFRSFRQHNWFCWQLYSVLLCIIVYYIFHYSIAFLFIVVFHFYQHNICVKHTHSFLYIYPSCCICILILHIILQFCLCVVVVFFASLCYYIAAPISISNTMPLSYQCMCMWKLKYFIKWELNTENVI